MPSDTSAAVTRPAYQAEKLRTWLQQTRRMTEVEAAVAGSVGGLEALKKCLQDFQKKFSKQEAHQDWLEALKEAVVGEGYTNEKVLKDSLTTDGKKAIANDSNI